MLVMKWKSDSHPTVCFHHSNLSSRKDNPSLIDKVQLNHIQIALIR